MTATDDVLVRHAVPLLHVPVGSRKQELRLVRMETRAALRRCADADLRPVWSPRNGDAFHLDAAGDLWAQVRIPVTERTTRTLSPAAFAAFLRGEHDPGGPVEAAILRWFMRTPLSPRDLAAGRSIAVEAKRARGAEMPARGPGLVLHDGRERGGADLAAFLDREVLVGEDAVYLRTAPLLRAVYARRYAFHVSPCRSFEPQLGDIIPMPDPGHREAFRGAYPGRTLDAYEPMVEALRAAGALDRWQGSEATVYANVLPGYVIGQLNTWTSALSTSDHGVPEEARRPIRADALRAMTGSIDAGEAPAVIGRALDALRAHEAHMSEIMATGDMGPIVAHVERAVLPCVGQPAPMPGDDAEALGSLAP